VAFYSPKGLDGLARWCDALFSGGASFPGRGMTPFQQTSRKANTYWTRSRTLFQLSGQLSDSIVVARWEDRCLLVAEEALPMTTTSLRVRAHLHVISQYIDPTPVSALIPRLHNSSPATFDIFPGALTALVNAIDWSVSVIEPRKLSSFQFSQLAVAAWCTVFYSRKSHY